MKCPQCGTEFEAEVKQCFTCGWDFNENPADFVPRRSKLAIFSLVLGILCLFTLYLPLLAAVIVGGVALRKIRKSRGKLTGERIAMAGILIPLFSLLIIAPLIRAVWSKDAGPVPNEFTEADYLQVKPENEASWELLLQLNDKSDDPNGAPAIGLTKSDLEMLDELWDNDPNTVEEKFQFIGEHAVEIESLWNKSEKGRAIFEQLAEFDEIAVYTPADLDTIEVFNFDAKYLARIYMSKCLLLQQEGKDVEAVQLLLFFDEIARKYTVNARSLISKLVGYAMLSMDICVASDLVNSPDISVEALSLLESRFTRLNQNTMSLRNCIIHEYFIYKNSLDGILQEGVKKTMLKPNSSCRYYDGYCRQMIRLDADLVADDYCPISVWPWEKPNWPKVSVREGNVGMSKTYTLYNPVGSMLTQILFPAHGKILEIKDRILIYDDMLQWVLARRMGQEGSLKARAYSDEYTVDVEKGLVFSVGPDGEPYTKDDIKLRIDPVVLGLE